MTIEAAGNQIRITLDFSEAMGIVADHGEGALLIPTEDTLGAIIAVRDALREAHGAGKGK
ncbi:MAG TPA: hypothetical protein VIM84_00025 [Gemmatimonadales bacterium]